MRNSRIEVIALDDGDDISAATRELRHAGVSVWARPDKFGPSLNLLSENAGELNPLVQEDQHAGRVACWYGHVLVDIAPASGTANERRNAVLQAWAMQALEEDDHINDEDQPKLVTGLPCGPVMTVALPEEPEVREFVPRHAWRWSWGNTALQRNGRRAFADFDRLNATLQRVRAKTAHRRAEALLPEGVLTKAGFDLGSDPTLASLRAMFGRASAQTRRTKETIDRFNYFAALTPVLSVVGYETARLMTPDDRSFALLVYIAVIGSFLTGAYILAAFDLRKRFHDLRAAAELLRVQIFWRLAGVDARVESSVRGGLPGALPTIEAVARSIDFVAARDGPPNVRNINFVAESWIGSQAHWHGEVASLHERRDALLKVVEASLQVITFMLAVGLACWLLGRSYTGTSAGFDKIVEALAISGLPAVAGGFAILRDRFSYQTLSDNYAKMFRLSRSATLSLREASGATSKVRLIEKFGREMIHDSVEWIVSLRLRPRDRRGL